LLLIIKVQAQIAIFYIYKEVLIGGYAFSTNKYLGINLTYKLIDESKKNAYTLRIVKIVLMIMI